jgi:hypothetical protein
MKKILHHCVLLLCILATQFFASAESFRVHKTVVADIVNPADTVRVKMGINDVLSINLPKDNYFIQGIELEIKIPSDAAAYRDAVAYSFYSDISPVPSPEIIDYNGTRLHINTFPGRLSYNVRIPVFAKHGMKDNPYSVLVPITLDTDVSSIFFRLQLVMKGTTKNLDNSVFDVSIKPSLIDYGLFKLGVLYPESEPGKQKGYTVFIDEKQVDVKKPLLLPVGKHHLSIVSEFYRSEVRTFNVVQAETSFVEVALRDIIPLVNITVPENAQVFIDDELVEGDLSKITVVPGDHTILFKIGNYEVVKSLHAENGKTYYLSTVIDVDIVEE